MRARLPYLHKVSDGAALSREQAAAAMVALLDDEYPPEQAAMFMGALRARGETVEELVGFATTLRQRAVSLTLAGATHVVHLAEGVLREMLIYPEEAGLPRSPGEALRGGDAEDNARLIESLLRGELHGPQRDVVTLNAAALLQLAGLASGLRDGAFLVGEVLDSGQAHRLLRRLREIHP